MGNPTSKTHLLFDRLPRPDKRKTDIYLVYNNTEEDPIGTICWLGAWRQYALYPVESTAWSRSCLREVNDFIDKLMSDRRKK